MPNIFQRIAQGMKNIAQSITGAGPQVEPVSPKPIYYPPGPYVYTPPQIEAVSSEPVNPPQLGEYTPRPSMLPPGLSGLEFTPQSMAVLRDYINNNPNADGSYMTAQEALQSEEYRQLVIDLSSWDNSPNGPKAQALVKLGRRRPEWNWAVGETPKE